MASSKLARIDQEEPMHKTLKNIFIVGGTHGNERGGVHLARAYESSLAQVAGSALSAEWTKTLRIRGVVANEKAVLQNTRYFHEDLNRCFTMPRLATAGASSGGGGLATYESTRAGELNRLLGPKAPLSASSSSSSSSASTAHADFIFDLHNSTSNTGMMLCLHRHDALAREVAAHLHRLDPAVKIVYWSRALGDDQPFLPTLGKSGMTVELGAVCHGTTNSVAIERVRVLLNRALAYLHRRALLVSSSSDFDAIAVEHRVNIGERVAQVDFPRDAPGGDATAFIAPALQDVEELADESYLRAGQPLFTRVDGSPAVLFDPAKYAVDEQQRRLYPVFVNEAAYFEKQTAFFLYTREDAVPVRVLPAGE